MLQVSTAVNELFNKMERYCVAPGLVERSKWAKSGVGGAGRGRRKEKRFKNNCGARWFQCPKLLPTSISSIHIVDIMFARTLLKTSTFASFASKRVMRGGFLGARAMGGGPFLGAKEELTGTIPQEADHATGARREEYDDEQLGRERFNSSALYVDTPGTVANPTLVPSMEAERVVGHMCDRFGANLITWCTVKQNEITVCPDCGHAFQLDRKLAENPLPAY